MTPSNWLIYGTGTIAKALAQELSRIGHQPIIAGANEQAVLALAETLQSSYRIFALDKPYAIQQQLQDIEIVLDANESPGAPLSYFVEACLKANSHYVALQPWPNSPQQIENLQQQAVAKGLVLIFASAFVPQALALWQASVSPAPDTFILDDPNAYLLPIVTNSVVNKTFKGLQLCGAPAIYWQAGHKTAAVLWRAKAWARLLKVFKKSPPTFKGDKSASLNIKALTNGTQQQTLVITTDQMQRLHLKTAVFLLESLLACKILPGVYSAYEVVDNNPEQAQELLDNIFTDPRAKAHD